MCAREERCGSDEVTRVVIPLVTYSVLECDKHERVAKTNVWVKIKRNGEHLQGFEDKLKESEEKGNSGSSNKDFESSGLQTKSGLRPNSRK